MIPILSSNQIREADAHTIEHEPITSIDLMERASRTFIKRFCEFVSIDHHIKVFCGLGNNGGDGLAIARMLINQKYKVHIYIVGNVDLGSMDFEINCSRLQWYKDLHRIKEERDFPLLNQHEIIVDAIFGSGLSRPIEGLTGQIVEHINHAGCKIVSVDIASGLPTDQKPAGKQVIRPWKTITFQVPKLAFYQPSLAKHVGDWYVESIGLNEDFLGDQKSFYHQLEQIDIRQMLKPRTKYMHKGDAGKLQLIAGSKGKMGAAVLSARAAMRAGAGLLTVHVPACGVAILQVSLPEAMVKVGESDQVFSGQLAASENHILAIGPGIGTHDETVKAFTFTLKSATSAMILDADALNILARNKDLLHFVPKQSILTPHPVEFQRLVGEWEDDYEKLALLRTFCIDYNLNVVLKGANSAICDADGVVCFNPTGNPGMATAGSGDVLTGIVAAFLTQGYAPKESLRMAVFLHGRAGDLAVKKVGQISLIASDIIDHLPLAIGQVLS